MEATKREKALIFALVAGYIDTWREAYIYSRDREIKNIIPENVDPAIVTRWKQRLSIQEALKDAQKALKDRDDQITETARRKFEEEGRTENAGESERPEPRKQKRVDYSDPEARRKLYNEIILKAADDPKTQLDAAKVIEQTQRDDKQAARERKTVVFFTPLRCLSCELYLKAQKKAAKG